MLQSLEQQCPSAHVYVLCMDVQTLELLNTLQLNYVTCIALADMENDVLLAIKPTRSVAEYCWTLSSYFTGYVMQNNPQIEFLTYLDADLLFYSPVQPLFDEIGASSVAIIEHRFTPRLQHLEVNGRFCVEWVGFRRDDEGLACLTRWRDQCLEWCFYRLEEGRMGDQKYLDEWPGRYPSLCILQHPGAGIAPWNYAQYTFGQNAQGVLTVNHAPLIFYHFHQFQLLEGGKFDRLSNFYTSECQEPITVYVRYEAHLTKVLREVRRYVPTFNAGMKPTSQALGRRWMHKILPHWAHKYIPRWLMDLARRIISVA